METKTCKTCGQNKPETEFHYRDKQSGRRSSWCKSCSKEYKKKHYDANRDKYLATATVSRNKKKALLKSIVLDYLSKHPCIDCGESDPIVLEFDHRCQSEKTGNICSMVCNGVSEESLIEEISKCDVRCANCHRRKTAKQLGYHQFMEDDIIKETKRTRRDSQKIRCIETGQEFESILEARKSLRISWQTMNDILTGKRDSIRGMSFEKI